MTALARSRSFVTSNASNNNAADSASANSTPVSPPNSVTSPTDASTAAAPLNGGNVSAASSFNSFGGATAVGLTRVASSLLPRNASSLSALPASAAAGAGASVMSPTSTLPGAGGSSNGSGNAAGVAGGGVARSKRAVILARDFSVAPVNDSLSSHGASGDGFAVPRGRGGNANATNNASANSTGSAAASFDDFDSFGANIRGAATHNNSGSNAASATATAKNQSNNAGGQMKRPAAVAAGSNNSNNNTNTTANNAAANAAQGDAKRARKAAPAATAATAARVRANNALGASMAPPSAVPSSNSANSSFGGLTRSHSVLGSFKETFNSGAGRSFGAFTAIDSLEASLTVSRAATSLSAMMQPGQNAHNSQKTAGNASVGVTVGAERPAMAGVAAAGAGAVMGRPALTATKSMSLKSVLKGTAQPK